MTSSSKSHHAARARLSLSAWRGVGTRCKTTVTVHDVEQGGEGHKQKGVVTMDEDGRNRFEIPKEMRSMAEASFDQARKAFESFLANAEQTASSIEGKGATVRASAKDISARAVAFAEKNVAASLDFAQQLLHAKDLADVMRLHSEYIQGQMKSLAEQASEMGQLVSRAAMEAAKPKN